MLSTVTLSWDLTDLIESGLSATLSITPTAQMSDTADHVLIPPVARTYTFTGGAGSLAGIVANDNAGILPPNSGYLISVTASSGQVLVPQFQTQLLTANGATQWLDALAVVPVVATSYQYLPLPSGTPVEGDVPIVIDDGSTATAWGPNGSGGGGSGTVTTVSVATANGFAGTVANPTTTPAITLKTGVTGLLKGNATAVSAATAGTDYVAPTGSGAALTGITAAQVGADASGAAATAQSNAETFATSAVGTETTRAEGAESTLSTAIGTETTRAETAEGTLTTAVAGKVAKAGDTMTGKLSPTVTTVTFASTVTLPATTNVLSLTLTGACTINAPSSANDGDLLRVRIIGANSHAVTWGTGWSWGTAGAPTLAGPRDRIVAEYVSSVPVWDSSVDPGHT